ncbi:MAG TPA: glycosyltransferase family 39 protein [Acidimicrobiales bacterium]|nr:glycosyltransferase family 39 protein [Acidimicrobiales bacterium]
MAPDAERPAPTAPSDDDIGSSAAAAAATGEAIETAETAGPIEAASAADAARRPWPFGAWLAVSAVTGLGVRLAYTIGWRIDAGLQYDGPVYVARARFLREGLAFKNPDAWFFSQISSEGAVHPPGNALLIAAAQQIGLRSAAQIQLLGCAVGVTTIVVIGLLGREVAGRRVGIVAAAIAAVSPGLWSYDPTAMAESPGQLLTAILLLLAYRFWQTPTVRRAAYLGGLAGLAALTRSELLILVAVFVLPLCFIARGTTRQALTRVGAATLWTLMVIGPWLGWNLVRFEHPVTMASGIDLSLAYAQCDDTWYGTNTGYWNLFCATNVTEAPENVLADESELGTQYRSQAGRYIADHRSRWPIVIAARAGRTLSVYPPNAQITVEAERESRERPVLWAATLATWCTYLLAAAAFARPPRSRRHLLPLLAPLVAGIAGATITFGTSRYRSAGEVGLIVLAAVGIDAIGRTWNARAPERGSPADLTAADGPPPHATAGPNAAIMGAAPTT